VCQSHLPCDARHNSKLSLQELHAKAYLVYHAAAVTVGFVVLHNTTVGELKAPLLHQAAHNSLAVLVQLLPPLDKECHVSIYKRPVWVID
jgi:hypothetical protein